MDSEEPEHLFLQQCTHRGLNEDTVLLVFDYQASIST